MSIRRVPVANAAIDYSQAGFIIGITLGAGSYTGHAKGFDGTGSQNFLEFLFGVECSGATSADNTTGTKFFPDIPYATSIFTMSRNSIGLPMSAGIQCKNAKIEGVTTFGYTANQDNIARSGIYDPDDGTNHIFIDYSDEIFGRFSRVALAKPVLTSDRHYIRITKGIDWIRSCK